MQFQAELAVAREGTTVAREEQTAQPEKRKNQTSFFLSRVVTRIAESLDGCV
jgi:hypothetical protein